MPKHVQSHVGGTYRPRLLPSGGDGLGGDGGVSPATGILLTDLVAHWDLTEASGTRADSHTNALHLTDVNTVGSAAGVGGVSTAASFVHTNLEYLTVANNDVLCPEDQWFVANYWAQYSGASSNFAGFVSKGLDPFFAGGEWLGNYFSDNHVIARPADNSARVLVNTAEVTVATWAMLTFVHDPVGNELRQYINGVLAGTGTLTGGIYKGTGALNIGGLPTSNEYVTGLCQSLSIWKGPGAEAALSHLAWLYNTGASARLYADLQVYTG